MSSDSAFIVYVGFIYSFLFAAKMQKKQKHAYLISIQEVQSSRLYSAANGEPLNASPTVKNPPAMRETWIQSLGWEDSLEECMATQSSILAWRIPTDKRRLGSQRVRSDWATKHSIHTTAPQTNAVLGLSEGARYAKCLLLLAWFPILVPKLTYQIQFAKCPRVFHTIVPLPMLLFLLEMAALHLISGLMPAQKSLFLSWVFSSIS